MNPHSSGSTVYHTITAEAVTDISEQTYNENISDITDTNQYPFSSTDLDTPFLLTAIAENHGNEAHTSNFVEVGDETSSVVSDTPPNPSEQDGWFSFSTDNSEPNYTDIDGLNKEYSLPVGASNTIRTDSSSIYVDLLSSISAYEKNNTQTERWDTNKTNNGGVNFSLYTDNSGTDVLVFAEGTNITALDRADGSTVWSVGLSNDDVSAIEYDSANNRLFYAAGNSIYGIDTTASDISSFVSNADDTTSVGDYNAFYSSFTDTDIPSTAISAMDIYNGQVIYAHATSGDRDASVAQLSQSNDSQAWITQTENLDDSVTSLGISEQYGFVFIGGFASFDGGSLERVNIEKQLVDRVMNEDKDVGITSDVTINNLSVVSNSYGDVGVFTAGLDSGNTAYLRVYNGLSMETPYTFDANLASTALTFDSSGNLFTDGNSTSGRVTKWSIDSPNVVGSVDVYSSDGNVWRQV
jgi:hypothetical protein